MLIESSRAYGRGLLRGIASYARLHGPWSIYHHERALGDAAPEWLSSWQGDGIIARVESERLVQQLKRTGLPTVDLRGLHDIRGIPLIETNDVQVVRLAIEHLRQRGFRNFAYCGFAGANYSERRLRYFIEQLSEVGCIPSVYQGQQADRFSDTSKIESAGLADQQSVAGSRASEIGLLGEVSGLRVLEVGCGGGQNSLVLTRWGATCVGIDPSSVQLAHARRLAQEQGLAVRFASGIAEDLSDFQDGSFDLVLSSYAFDYVADLGRACSEAWRVLKPGGLFVFCQSHPWFQAVGWHLVGDADAAEVGDYAAWPDLEEWDWEFEDGTSAPMRGHLRPLAQIVNCVIDSGFHLERMVEQATEDVAGASAEELARLPYLNSYDPHSERVRNHAQAALYAHHPGQKTGIVRGRVLHSC